MFYLERSVFFTMMWYKREMEKFSNNGPGGYN